MTTEEDDLMMDVEDGWSYSMPPSLEFLPLKQNGSNDDSNLDKEEEEEEEEDKESVISELEEENNIHSNNGKLVKTNKGLKIKTDFHNNGHSFEDKQLPPRPIDIIQKPDVGKDHDAVVDGGGGNNNTSGVLITTPPKQTMQPTLSSVGSSYSTSSLNQMMKSSPLGPLTTVEEVHNNKSSPSRSNTFMELSSVDEKSGDGSTTTTTHKKLTGTIYQLQQTMSVNSIQSGEKRSDDDDNEDEELRFKEQTQNTTDSTIDLSNGVDTTETVKLPSSESNGSFFSSFRNVAQSMLQSPSGSQVRVSSDSGVNSSATTTTTTVSSLEHRRVVSQDVKDHRRVASQDVKDHRRNISTASSFVPTVSENGEFRLVGSEDHHPDIISYRRSKRPKSSSVSSTNSVLKSPAASTEIGSPLSSSSLSFDKHLYIDEFYKETQYRYATLKRNADFHNLFVSIPVDDRLLDDFSCALSREILIQGRMYISENHIGFNSNILGWVTNLVVPFKDVVNIEKKLTAGLFNNGIAIETKDTKHYFATFITRDATFQFLNSIWENAAKLPSETSSIFKNRQMNLKYKSDGIGLIDFSKPEEESKELLDDPFEFQNIQNITMSIDGDTPRRASDMELIDLQGGDETGLKPGCNYHNDGPESHSPTDIDHNLKEKNETLLFSENFNAPPGLIFNILFGENIAFHKHLMELGEGSNFSDYSKFEDKDDELIREFTYTKALGYSIGPKSTKVEVVEHIEKKDYDSIINVLTTTVTPDVPSGNVFSVNTRYIFAWGANNTTNFQLSYFMNWTGKSWFKGIIESQTATGQKSASELLSKELREKLSQVMVYSKSSSEPKLTTPVTPITRHESTSFEEKLEKEVETVENAIQSFGQEICAAVPKWLALVLLLVLGLQIYTISMVQRNNSLIQHQIKLTELLLVSNNNNNNNGEKKTVKEKISDMIFSNPDEDDEVALDKKIESDLEYYNREMGKS